MKNPDSKSLRILLTNKQANIEGWAPEARRNYALVLSNLAIAQSNLVKAGKDSAMPHFIAIVKELERLYGFAFEIMEE